MNPYDWLKSRFRRSPEPDAAPLPRVDFLLDSLAEWPSSCLRIATTPNPTPLGWPPDLDDGEDDSTPDGELGRLIGLTISAMFARWLPPEDYDLWASWIDSCEPDGSVPFAALGQALAADRKQVQRLIRYGFLQLEPEPGANRIARVLLSVPFPFPTTQFTERHMDMEGGDA